MSIKRYDHSGCTEAALRQILKGYRMVREEFGALGTGKTTRATALADKLSQQGMDVIIIDDLQRGHQRGYRVFVRSGHHG